MTTEQLEQSVGIAIRDIREGDLMRVTMDDGRRRLLRVRRRPWPLGDGTLVIGLEGIAGGYALERCAYLEETPPE